MKSLTLAVPTMYADHHVLKVREALAGLSGVQGVVASAARRQVTLQYQEGDIAPEEIAQALADAGYRPQEEIALGELPKRSQDGSPWYTVLPRVTTTEAKDLEMSGDFRRY